MATHASSDKRGASYSVAFLSKVCLWAVSPRFGQEGRAGERKLKQPFFGRQLEPKKGGVGPLPQLIPKTNAIGFLDGPSCC